MTTDFDRSTIRLAADYADAETITYSGRNMYGEKCLGLVVKGGGFGGFAQFLLRVSEESPELAQTLAMHPHCDNMGRDTVVYWPGLEWADDDDDDDDDDETPHDEDIVRWDDDDTVELVRSLQGDDDDD